MAPAGKNMIGAGLISSLVEEASCYATRQRQESESAPQSSRASATNAADSKGVTGGAAGRDRTESAARAQPRTQPAPRGRRTLLELERRPRTGRQPGHVRGPARVRLSGPPRKILPEQAQRKELAAPSVASLAGTR
ncbi:MAG: hypothetical protein M1826_002552 [Phylliscum demangeonii]|nr:MAG: hypothetical protein M1826_002552 [Phylliscum demangeonii]